MSGSSTKRILVTGGTGRQGGAAIQSLMSLGYSMRI